MAHLAPDLLLEGPAVHELLDQVAAGLGVVLHRFVLSDGPHADVAHNVPVPDNLVKAGFARSPDSKSHTFLVCAKYYYPKP